MRKDAVIAYVRKRMHMTTSTARFAEGANDR
jgi:hypothetical protein